MLLLATNVREKTSQSQERRNFKSVHAIGNLHWCYNFALLALQLCTRVTGYTRF